MDEQEIEKKMKELYYKTSNVEYGTYEYWETRYKIDSLSFDWFKSYSFIKKFINEHIKREDRIVHLGCGNSNLSTEMYDDGYTNQINVDYSPTVIQMMKERDPRMEWITGDIFKLDSIFEKESIDCCLDKGTMDALLTKKYDKWDPEPKVVKEIQDYMRQVHYILKPNCSFYQITFCQPHFRRMFFNVDYFDLQVFPLNNDEGLEYFVYKLTKK